MTVTCKNRVRYNHEESKLLAARDATHATGLPTRVPSLYQKSLAQPPLLRARERKAEQRRGVLANTMRAADQPTHMLSSLLHATSETTHSSAALQAGCADMVALAERMPTQLYMHLHEVIKQLWVAAFDGKVETREAARRAIGACLSVVGQRDPLLRARWHMTIFEDAIAGLNEARSGGDAAHGSLLVLIELLNAAGEAGDPGTFDLASLQRACEANE